MLLMTRLLSKALLSFMALAVSLGWALVGCSPDHDNWKTLAVASGPAGEKYIARQTYYDLAEGWKVSFGYIDSSGNQYRYYLAHQSSRWRVVRVEATNGVVRIWKDQNLHAATFYPSNYIFVNHLTGTTYDQQSGRQGGAHPASFWVDNQDPTQ
jgi:hypothetical protein